MTQGQASLDHVLCVLVTDPLWANCFHTVDVRVVEISGQGPWAYIYIYMSRVSCSLL